MPPRIEPMRHPVPQPIPVQEFVRNAARTPARVQEPAAQRAAVAGPARVAVAPRHPIAPRQQVAAAPHQAQRPPLPPAPLLARTVPREPVAQRPAPVQVADARPGAAVRHAAVEPIQHQLPERVVQMLNAQRGRQAVTAIAQARGLARAAVADAATARQPVAAVAPQPVAATAVPTLPPARVAEAQVPVEPAAPAVRFTPTPAERPQFTAAAVTNEQVRQAAAREAFQAAVNTRVAEENRPAGAPTQHRAIIDQRA